MLPVRWLTARMEAPLSRDQLVSQLATARKARSVSIRRASSLVGLPASTLQGWFEGRHLPTQALMPQFLELLVHLGLAVDDADQNAWAAAVAELRSVRVISDPPYSGLSPYTAEQAPLYFGRESALRKLIDACLRPPDPDTSDIIVLLGESGSGKSSLLAAGLIGRATGEGGELAHLVPLLADPADVAGLELPDEPTLLVVDQFEELELLIPERQRAALERLSSLPEHVTCVLALRADAIGLAMRDEWLARDLSTPVVLGPVSRDDFVQIIERPALKHGRSVSPELTQLLLRDIYAYGEPAPGVVLPLLSSVLRQCWEASTGPTITPADYLATGGLWAALNQEADSIYESLTASQRRSARRLLLSLFNVEGALTFRRRIATSALGDDLLDAAEPFVRARILTRLDDHLQVTHDALLLHWHRLAGWVEEAQASLLLGRRIHLAAQLWDEGGRTSDALMPVEAQLWREWADSDEATVLSHTERAFIEASCEQGEAEQAQQRRTMSRIRRRQNIAVVAAAVALVMVAATILASARSEGFRQQAEETATAAQARQIALISDEVRATSANVAAQLSVAALALDDNVQTRSSVLSASASEVPSRAIGPTGNTMVAMSADGDLIVSADSEGRLSVWRDGALSLAPETAMTGGRQLFGLSLRETGERILVLVAGQDTASVWDVTSTPRRLGEFGGDTVGYSAAWQGDVALFGTLEGTVRRVDLSDPERPRRLTDLDVGETVSVTGLAANERWILAGGRRDTVDVFDSSGARHEPLAVTGTVLSIAASPTGDRFLFGTTLRQAGIRDGSDLRILKTIATSSGVNAVAHLGDRLIVAGSFGTVDIYSPDGASLHRYPGRSIVTGVAGSGDSLVVGSSDGEVNHWAPAPGRLVLQTDSGTPHFDVTRSDVGLLIGTAEGAVVMSREGDGWVPRPIDPAPDGTSYNPYYAISADGSTLVNQSEGGQLVTLAFDGEGYRVSHAQPLPTGLIDLQMSPDGTLLTLGYRNKADFQLFRADDRGWSKVATLDGWPSSSAFSADSSLFVGMTLDGKGFNVWRVSGDGATRLAERRTTDAAVPIRFAFAPDGTLALGDDAGEVTLYDMSDPAAPRASFLLGDARASLSQLQFDDAGEQLIAASRAGTVWVWSREGKGWSLYLTLRPGQDNVMGVEAYEGEIVMSMDDGRTVAWEDDPATARDAMCGTFGDPLTDQEWERLVPGVEFVDGCD